VIFTSPQIRIINLAQAEYHTAVLPAKGLTLSDDALLTGEQRGLSRLRVLCVHAALRTLGMQNLDNDKTDSVEQGRSKARRAVAMLQAPTSNS
jgi:hypothetical protein